MVIFRHAPGVERALASNQPRDRACPRVLVRGAELGTGSVHERGRVNLVGHAAAFVVVRAHPAGRVLAANLGRSRSVQ